MDEILKKIADFLREYQDIYGEEIFVDEKKILEQADQFSTTVADSEEMNEDMIIDEKIFSGGSPELHDRSLWRKHQPNHNSSNNEHQEDEERDNEGHFEALAEYFFFLFKNPSVSISHSRNKKKQKE